MNFVHIVAILAIGQCIFFSVLVGNARSRYGVQAPAMAGHEQFDRIFRVHMNTLEQLICFLPALFIASAYWPGMYVAAAGAVYLIGRLVYWRAYLADPARRSAGFALTVMPTIALLVAGLLGALGMRL
jgi:uncharacterized MAPEG superfamily protein